MKGTKTMAKALKINGEWQPGRIAVYDRRLDVTVETTDGPAKLVFELIGKSVMFRGVERVSGSIDAIQVSHIGQDALPRATWLRIYRADAERRSHYT